MAGKDTPKTSRPGCLCGITSQYWENLAAATAPPRLPTGDLPSAMGVDWEDPESLDRKIARRRLGAWGRLVRR